MNHFLASVVLAVAIVATTCGNNADSTDPTRAAQQGAGTTATPTPSTTVGPSSTPATADNDLDLGDENAATSTTPTGSGDSSDTSQLTEADLARFVAAAEAALADTTARGRVVADPETYIVLGQVACARFSDGETFDDIATDLSDDPAVAGAVIGAAVETICAEHAAQL